MIPDSKNYFRNFLDSSISDPNLTALVVKVSFVYESNAGLTIRAFTNNHKFY